MCYIGTLYGIVTLLKVPVLRLPQMNCSYVKLKLARFLIGKCHRFSSILVHWCNLSIRSYFLGKQARLFASEGEESRPLNCNGLNIAQW